MRNQLKSSLKVKGRRKGEMHRYTAFFLTILILVLGGNTSALAFTFTTIDPPGSVSTNAVAVNDGGQIVGSFLDSSGLGHGFLRDKDGTFTIFDLGFEFTVPVAINNRGQIVGVASSGIPAIEEHGFLRDKDGTLTQIDPQGSIFAGASAINNRGQIVGSFLDSNGVHGFLAVP